MEIYLEFRMTKITKAGYTAGIEDQDTENSIRWKKRTAMFPTLPESEGAIFDIYSIGTYVDPDPDLFLTSLLVKAVYREDPTIEIYTQIGGFVPRNNIYDIPLHITTVMAERKASINNPVEGIDHMSPMEGGIRPAENPSIQTIEDPVLIATARLEYNCVQELYKYIKPVCDTSIPVENFAGKIPCD